MVFWILAITVTVIACAALYYASAGRKVNAAHAQVDGATTGHFRLQLQEIETDLASSRLTPAEAVAAKGELAREMLRSESENTAPAIGATSKALLPVLLAAVVALSFGSYVLLGSPNLPSLPLAGRPDVAAAALDLDAAVARIEAQLAKAPDDLRGWTVIAPAYMQLGRTDDAINAYRRMLALGTPTAEMETDLAEALMLKADGDARGEPLQLLQSAAARDPAHIRSRFYIAGHLTRTGAFAEAKTAWQELLAIGKPDEPWITTAQEGLAAAEAGLTGTTTAVPPDQAAAIAGMVEGLATRLYADGGTLDEWTQLVRSYLVLNEIAAAQKAYDAAKAAYPRLMERVALDALAKDGGLK